MATLPRTFLDSTINDAQEHGLEFHVLPEDKGLLLFAKDLAASELCSLLENKTVELNAAQHAPVIDDKQTPNSQDAHEQSNIDCQVTVEERAQLFKFLTD